MASGEDYLKALDSMNQYVNEASVFYANNNAPRSAEISSELADDLTRKREALKTDAIR
jgi:hypothetical protein